MKPMTETVIESITVLLMDETIEKTEQNKNIVPFMLQDLGSLRGSQEVSTKKRSNFFRTAALPY